MSCIFRSQSNVECLRYVCVICCGCVVVLLCCCVVVLLCCCVVVLLYVCYVLECMCCCVVLRALCNVRCVLFLLLCKCCGFVGRNAFCLLLFSWMRRKPNNILSRLRGLIGNIARLSMCLLAIPKF